MWRQWSKRSEAPVDPIPLNVSRASTLFLSFAIPCFVLALKSYLSDVRIVSWPLEVGGHPAFRDFANLWAGGIAAWTAHYDVLFNRSLHAEHIAELLGVPKTNPMWSYPPTAMLLMMPFALLPYAWGCAVWTLTGLAAYLAAARVVGTDRHADLMRLGAIALCPGLFLCLTYGQTAFLTSAVLVTGIAMAATRPILAGALLALLAAKPQIAIVVPFALLAMGAWRACAATAFFAVVFVAATVAVLGLDPWRDFVTVTLPQQFTVLTAPAPYDRFDPTLIISPFYTLDALGLSMAPAYAIQLLISFGVIAWLVASLRSENDVNIRTLLIACAVLLVSPYALTYELPILILAVARIVADPATLARLDERRVSVLCAAVTVAPLLILSVLTHSGVNFFCVVPLSLLIWLGVRALARSNGVAPRQSVIGRSVAA